MSCRLAVQLFTLRDQCAQDFDGAVQELHQIGYRAVELAGYYHYDYREMARTLENYGVQVAGMHVPLVRLREELEQVLEEAAAFQTQDIICPGIPPAQRNEEGFRSVKTLLLNLAQKAQDKGFYVGYHNHAFELDTEVDGVTALEYVLNPDDGADIHPEIDLYWIAKAKQDPMSFLKPYAGRIRNLHVKDMTSDDTADFAPVGNGCLDFENILPWARSAGVKWLVVEHDKCVNPMDSVEMSYNYLTGRGFH